MLTFIFGMITGVVLTFLVLFLVSKNPPNFLPW